MEDNLYFNADEIASITDGEWENLNNRDIFIKEFHNTYHYLKSGDCFVVRSNNWPNPKAYRNNEHKIEDAIKKGISAVIADKELKIDADIPLLRVKNSYFAMKKLAKYASKATKAKKVLITGSYGKTAFKLNLYHISKKQKSCYTRKNSANYAASTYCKLASMKQKNDLFFLEIPVATKEKITRRSRLINPDIGVITSIGHENIERFKSIDNIIQNKLSITAGIKKGGKLLIPHDDRYYAKIKKEALKYKHVDILTYGSSRRCNANLLYKEFRDFGWNVIAKIEDKVVAYRVPFFEDYAVSASLGVLLCAYHLGLDIHKAADEYYTCENFKSSGIFYEVLYKNKRFYLYDQSNRGGIEGYESFFKTMSYIKPEKNGKKILLTSEFVDYDDGEMKFIDTKKFQKLIKSSGIKALYSVEKFSEHIDVLEDKSIWKNHSLDFNNIKDEIIDSIESGDILSVKGIFESNLPKFILHVKKLDGIELTKVKSENYMKKENFSFGGLKTLHVDDLDIFKEQVQKADKSSWVYYFPFLYFWSLSNSRELLIGRKNGVITLFLLHELNRERKPKLELFIPPLPFTEGVLESSLNALYSYDKKHRAKILWIDRDDLKKIRSFSKFDDILFKARDREYIYNPKIYNDLSGAKFRNIRRAVTKIDSLENIEVAKYSQKDKKECLELLNEWSIRQASKHNRLDNRYTKICLENAHLFDKKELSGLVLKIDSKIKSFNFSGEITQKTGNLFIAKSDHSISGLHVYMEYLMMLKMQNFDFLNAASDMGHAGLKHNKQILRPVKMLNMYKALYNQKIRLLDENHIDAISAVEKRAFKESYSVDIFKKESLLGYISKQRVYGYISTSGSLKGFIILKHEQTKLRIYALAVAVSNRGIGTKLLDYAIDKAKKYELQSLELEVDTSNSSAVNFYKKFGFKTKEVLKEYYKGGNDAYHMYLELS